MVWGVVGSARVVHQARYRTAATPSDAELPWEAVSFLTTDRVLIQGWLIRHPAPKGVLLLLHGFGTCKADLLDVARPFFHHGSYHLLLIDFRGHGNSGGNLISFGKQELLDIEAALDFLAGDASLKDFPVGCFGFSMGGAIGLLAAARFPKIQCVASDSAYASLAKAIARTQRMAYHIPWIPLGQMVIWGTEIRLRCRMRNLSPLTAVDKIAPRQVLLIHGMKDQGIPPQEAQALYHAARNPKELWLVPGAEHMACFYLYPEEYLQRVVDFFNDGFSRTA